MQKKENKSDLSGWIQARKRLKEKRKGFSAEGVQKEETRFSKVFHEDLQWKTSK